MAGPFAGAMQQGQPGQPMDYHKIFSAERDNLRFAEGLYNWLGDDVETRVLRKYGRLPSASSGSS